MAAAILTNVSRPYGPTLELTDNVWHDLDLCQIEFISFVPGTLRIMAKMASGEWCAFRINSPDAMNNMPKY